MIALIFKNSFFISSFLSHSISFVCLFFFFFLKKIFINNHRSWIRKEANTCCDDYVLMFVYVDSTSVEH